MQLRVVVAFLIGCVLGAMALYLYLQGSGKLVLVPPARRTPTRTDSSKLPAEPSGVPPARGGIAGSVPPSESRETSPKPLAVPDTKVLPAYPIAIPVSGVEKQALRDRFAERRGSRRHEALDIMAPRGTPVVAAVDGKIARLFNSLPGGLTIYQTDTSDDLIYYYAHLDRYAHDVFEGKTVLRGEVIGYVGTSGNAAENAPHLHFAIMRLPDSKQWWKGVPINPYPLLKERGVTYRIPPP